ncbi:SAF domain-containing protein [Candidatus Protofrankia californiensis]|uniref:SAF domain-containing protein n=1 Tax=Candidatus Protofrankia californiensis TaxID=1839754 RepID=UPI001F4954C4|nr:SAF domain-containing protein [Candidatus Protofrankia californiensis]
MSLGTAAGRADARTPFRVENRRRRRMGRRAIVGVLLVIVSIAAFVLVSASRGERRQVLVVVRDVPAGQALTAGDLRAVSVAADAGVDLVAADGQNGVVGRVAAVPLTAGSLLAARQVGQSRVPPAGQSIVGAAVRAGQYPVELARGDHILIILIQAGSTVTGTAAEQPATVGQAVAGLVVGVAPAEQGVTGAVLSLQVADADAQEVARAAAAGRIALIQQAAGGR